MSSLHNTLAKRVAELDETSARLEEANQEMQVGLNAVVQAQRALLPSAPPDVRQVNCSWYFCPCEHLGGDSLNIFKLADDMIGFFIADVCGHGMASSLLAVTLHRVLSPVRDHATLLTGGRKNGEASLFTSPDRVMTEVNRRFPVNIHDGEYFTAIYGLIDTTRSELRYATAGHPHPLLISKNKPPAKLPAGSFPIGFVDDTVYEEEVIPLVAGDRVCIYSDGIVEAANPEYELFGTERLAQHLQEINDWELDAVIGQITSDAQRWTRQSQQQDDVSIILLEFLGANVNNSPNDDTESDAPCIEEQGTIR